MNYDLIHELKQAGFPLKHVQHHVGPTPEDEGYTFIDGQWYLAPSLSELMYACGDYFVDIQRLAENDWKAGGGVVVDKRILYNCEITSSTPGEAVARLWLALKTV
jgi:hypothetical protein